VGKWIDKAKDLLKGKMPKAGEGLQGSQQHDRDVEGAGGAEPPASVVGNHSQ
jgi:hypothetical protein